MDGLVGRSAELGRLANSAERLAGGRGGILWIRGEGGIGKSALVDVLVERVRRSGCRVLRGAGDELAERFPLRMMADTLGVTAGSADPAVAQTARLLTGETAVAGAADPVLAAGERMLAHVDRWCAESPVLLVAEDLHWADEPSLLLWNRLARAVGQLPLLLVGTARAAPARMMLERLAELAPEQISLTGLDAGDAARLVGAQLGSAPGPRLAAELDRAGGNPFYLRELAGALAGEGLIDFSGGRAEFRGEPGAVPHTLTAAITRGLRFPAAGTAGVLRVAALLGRDFDLSELAIGTGRSAADLAPVVEESIAAGALRAAGERLVFRHELVRQVLAGQSAAATRLGLHQHLARELATAGCPMDAVARHVLAGPRAAGSWLPRWLVAIPEPVLYGAPQVAAELLDRALEPLSPDDPLWTVLAVRAVRVDFWLGRDEQVRRRAPEVARRHPDPDEAARMTTLAARAAARSGRLDEAIALTEVWREAGGEKRGGDAARATLHAWSAVALAVAGDHDRAVAEAAEARRLADGDGLATGYARHASALVCDTAADALGHVDAALAGLGDDLESTDLRLLLTNNRLTYLTALGRTGQARADLPAALTLAERAGTFRTAGLLATAAEVCYVTGAWSEALVHLSGIEPEFLGNTANLNAVALGALIALHRGDRAAAEEQLRLAGPPDADNAVNWRLSAAWALHAEVSDDPWRAARLMAGWLVREPVPGQSTRPEMMPWLVRLALSIGDRELAVAAAETCDADTGSGPGTAACCCHALLDGDAIALLATAEDSRAAGRPLEAALAFEEAAVLQAAAGQVVEARAALTSASRIYADLGAAWDLRRAEARLRPLGVRRGPRSLHRRATTGWAALTPAEALVADRVVRGMSNPDIAGELFLSRRTVQTHVSNILGKLGVSSRRDIVRQPTAR